MMQAVRGDRGLRWTGRWPCSRTSRGRRSARARSTDGGRRAEGRRAGSCITTDESVEGTAERISTTYDPLPQRRRSRRHDPPRRRQPRAEGGRATAETRSNARWSTAGRSVPQGHEPARRQALDPGPHREGPARPGLRRRQRRRLRGALLRAEGRRTWRRCKALIQSLGGTQRRDRQDREARGRGRPGRDPRGGRRRDGGPRRPGGRAVDRGGADPPEADHRDGQRRREGRDHRHPDAREHDREPAPDAGRGLRRGQRDPRRHRRRHALRRRRPPARYPVEAVETMARIARYTEEHYSSAPTGARRAHRRASRPAFAWRAAWRGWPSTVAEELDCKLIVAFTESGSTARLVSCYRPERARSRRSPTTRTPTGGWPSGGASIPVRSAFTATTDEMIVTGEELLKAPGLAAVRRHGPDAGRPEPHGGRHEHAAGAHDLQ